MELAHCDDPAGKGLLAAVGADEHSAVPADRGEDRVPVADRLDPGRDQVPLVEQVGAEVRVVGRARQVLGNTPGAGHPLAVIQDEADKRVATAGDDAVAAGEPMAAEGIAVAPGQKVLTGDVAPHPLAADFSLQRFGCGPEHVCLKQPRRTHQGSPCSAGPLVEQGFDRTSAFHPTHLPCSVKHKAALGQRHITSPIRHANAFSLGERLLRLSFA